MRHRAFNLIETIVVVAIIGILAAILFPVFQRADEGSSGRRHAQCQENLRSIGLAFLQYSQDYDEKLPPVANARAGYWVGSLQTYMKSWKVFQCPTDKTATPKTTDYYYNARLAQTDLQTVETPTATILSGEGTGDQPTNYNLLQMPNAWRKEYASPANRHIVRANYLFADGHIKSLNPEKVTPDKPSKNRPTFLVR